MTEHSAATGDVAAPDGEGNTGVWLLPPGRVFHAFVVLAAVLLVWGSSASQTTAAAMVGAFLSMILITVWSIWVVLFFMMRRRGKTEGSGWRFALAPLVAAAVMVIVSAQQSVHR